MLANYYSLRFFTVVSVCVFLEFRSLNKAVLETSDQEPSDTNMYSNCNVKNLGEKIEVETKLAPVSYVIDSNLFHVIITARCW